MLRANQYILKRKHGAWPKGPSVKNPSPLELPSSGNEKFTEPFQKISFSEQQLWELPAI
jgi:hypothetical protein